MKASATWEGRRRAAGLPKLCRRDVRVKPGAYTNEDRPPGLHLDGYRVLPGLGVLMRDGESSFGIDRVF